MSPERYPRRPESEPESAEVLHYERPSLVAAFGPPGFGRDLAAKADSEFVIPVDWSDPDDALSQIDAVLTERDSGLVDCSNATKRQRTLVYRLARRHGVPVVGVVLDERASRPYTVEVDSPATEKLRRQYQRTRSDLLERGTYDQQGFSRVQVFGPEIFDSIWRIEFG